MDRWKNRQGHRFLYIPKTLFAGVGVCVLRGVKLYKETLKSLVLRPFTATQGLIRNELYFKGCLYYSYVSIILTALVKSLT